jgi:hypothetical protein
VVTHKLCDRLRSRGQEAYLFIRGKPVTCPSYDTPLLPPWIPPRECIVIYPEVIHGNPLGGLSPRQSFQGRQGERTPRLRGDPQPDSWITIGVQR